MSESTSAIPWDSPEFYPEAHALAADRLSLVEHKGKRILTINSVGADLKLVKAIAAECWHIVSRQELQSRAYAEQPGGRRVHHRNREDFRGTGSQEPSLMLCGAL
jgi:hypothetical protein